MSTRKPELKFDSFYKSIQKTFYSKFAFNSNYRRKTFFSIVNFQFFYFFHFLNCCHFSFLSFLSFFVSLVTISSNLYFSFHFNSDSSSYKVKPTFSENKFSKWQTKLTDLRFFLEISSKTFTHKSCWQKCSLMKLPFGSCEKYLFIVCMINENRIMWSLIMWLNRPRLSKSQKLFINQVASVRLLPFA